MSEAETAFITYPDERLTQIAVSRPVDDALRSVGARLLAAAQGAQAYGLAAAHIGAVMPVVVVSLSDPASRDYHLLYNPRILATDGPEVASKEGSVSMPGIEVEVVRPERVLIGFDDKNGNPVERVLSGFAARVAQHEIDQMNGVFFLARVSRLKRDAAIKRFAKLSRRMG